MAITTVGEANAANALIRFFLDLPGYAGRLKAGDALIAVQRLRQSAYDKLAAGLLEEEVRLAFERHVAKTAAADTALDGAMFQVWIAGDWPVVTAGMSPEERDAAADAVIRYDQASFDDPANPLDVHALRWWR
jgi:hypothetical protein